MVARIFSCTLIGIEAHPVQVEIDITPGLPNFQTVGLPDPVVKESRERVTSALKNSGFQMPLQRVTVNLAPAELRKEGSSLDLAIAIGILWASNQLRLKNVELGRYMLIGELALNGELRPVSGVLSIVSSLQQMGVSKIILPAVNAEEAALVPRVESVPLSNLSEVVEFLQGDESITSRQSASVAYQRINDYAIDFSDVQGQEAPKRALEIAAAGGHNIILVGPPGSGKTMLARRFPTILPELSIEEAIETTKIYSAAKLLPLDQPLVRERPFRSPHHTVSDAGLIGGGQIPRPGEVSLAHNGVLFLDEFPEFRRNVLEALRQPLEDGVVTIARSAMTLTYPARFILAAAMNPCPCGFLTDPRRECICRPLQIQKYRSKVSGPLLDRIDIHIEVPPASYQKIMQSDHPENSAHIRQRIERARLVQLKRFKNHSSVFFNAHMSSRQIKSICTTDTQSQHILQLAMEKLHLSVRAYHKVLKVARTIADLEGCESIKAHQISEAIQYRALDRDLFS